MKLNLWRKKKEPPKDPLHNSRMEALQKDIDSSNEIIEQMKNFKVERRLMGLSFEGTERRNA